MSLGRTAATGVGHAVRMPGQSFRSMTVRRCATGRRHRVVTETSDDGHGRDIEVRQGAPYASTTGRCDIGGASLMHRLTRLVGLAGVLATLVASLAAGSVAAAGSP